MNHHITVRRATADDAEAIQRIFDAPRAVWGTLQTPFMSVEQRRKRLAEIDQNAYPLVALVDGEVVGQLTLITNTRPRRKHAAAFGMAVRDDYHGMGVGAALMEAMLGLADGWLNLRRIELDVYVDNAPAIHLYEKYGFVIEGRLVDYAYRDGAYVDAYMMARMRKEPE